MSRWLWKARRAPYFRADSSALCWFVVQMATNWNSGLAKIAGKWARSAHAPAFLALAPMIPKRIFSAMTFDLR